MHVTDAEQRILEVLWKTSPLTAAEVTENLAGQDWHRKTVNTLIARLVEKGALSADEGRPKRFAPAIEREAFAADQVEALADGLFGGRLAPLVASFVERDGIAREDIEALKDLVDRLEGEADD